MRKYLENYPLMLSVNEVAQILGVTDKTVRNLVKTKQLSGVKVGRLIRIPKDKIIDYLEQ